jgi:UDP-glucose 4-epimerase
LLKGKLAIVTGNRGFIGSVLETELWREGTTVIGWDKANGFDLGHRDNLRETMTEVDYVFHMAVLPINPCTQDMRLCIETNAIGTLNVVEAAKAGGVKKIIYSSTSAVYGNMDDARVVDETRPCNPNSMYGITKLAGELIVKNSGVPYIILRYMNVYGIGQKSGLIPILLQCVKNNIPPTIDGDGQQAFDFVHVQDIVRANILAANSNVENETFNIGGDNEITVSEVVKAVLEAAASKLVPVHRPGDSRVRRVGSSAKARKLLGYAPSVDFKIGIKEIIDEYFSKNEHTDH